MKKGKLALAGACLALVATMAIVPPARLASERAAAKREGMWTTAADVRRAIGTVPTADNAAPLIQAAIAADRKAGLKFDDASLERWRTAASKPRLDYGRHYEDGYLVLFPELAPTQAAARALVHAARLGKDPKQNLLAAARLSALVRQEPGVIAAIISGRMAKQTLDAAQTLHLAPEVESALGPAPDVKWIIGPELTAFVDTYPLPQYESYLRDLGVHDQIGWFERLRHSGPMAQTAIAGGIGRWRTLWQHLPRDPHDLTAAAGVVDRDMPAIDKLMPDVADVMEKLTSTRGSGRGGFLRDLADLEHERASIRASSTEKRR